MTPEPPSDETPADNTEDPSVPQPAPAPAPRPEGKAAPDPQRVHSWQLAFVAVCAALITAGAVAASIPDQVTVLVGYEWLLAMVCVVIGVFKYSELRDLEVTARSKAQGKVLIAYVVLLAPLSATLGCSAPIWVRAMQ